MNILKSAIIVLILCLTQTSYGQNLLNNGHFDSDTQGWNLPNGSNTLVNWISNDGNSSNGSLEMSDNFNNGGFSSITSDRVSVIGGQPYQLKGYAKVISESEANDAGFFIRFYNADNLILVNSEITSVFDGPKDTWNLLQTMMMAPADAVSADVSIAIGTENSGSSNFSTVRWDDLSFTLITDDPNQFPIVPGHSALWFNPQQNGHGINVYLLADQRVLVLWYVYDQQGQPLWLLGSGDHNGVVATLMVSQFNGAMFPPDFDAQDLMSDSWGTFTLSFSGCDAGLFQWDPIAGNGFSSGQMDIVRLNNTLGLSCQE